MPWRGPEYEGEFPTLGYEVADWIEAHCAVPDGDRVSEPFELSEGQLRHLLWAYRLDPATGRRAFRRTALVRSQKWGKGPFASAVTCAQAEGPTRFAGWDANGDPVGRPWETPLIQLVAWSLEQVDNTWRSLLPMIQLGPLADIIPDTGETRINLPGGGRIEPVTAEGRSRLGARLTFAIVDETHSYVGPAAIRLAETVRRNLAGMGADTWAMETTNAWDPSEDSVAQRTADHGGPDVFLDFPAVPAGSFGNKRDRIRILRANYADAPWVDVDRVNAECEELIAVGDQQQAERFFGNRIIATADQWLEPDLWAACPAAPPLEPGERVALGFDGSRVDDHTALVAASIDTGAVHLLAHWAPTAATPVDPVEVDAAVHEAFASFTVVRMYADPPHWQDLLSAWAGEFGGAVMEFWTTGDRRMAAALERFHTAVTSGAVAHPADTVLTDHVTNARRRKSRAGFQIAKPAHDRKIDAAVAAVLAWEARGDALAAADQPKPVYASASFA